MKVYMSLDFASAPARIEKNVAGEYCIHAEDFENINDLVQRSIRTRTKLPDLSSDRAEYDDEFEPQTPENQIDQSEVTANKPAVEPKDGERSEAAEAQTGGDLSRSDAD